MHKYSQFGLSFLKSFLVQKGANPVFYIAKNSMINGDMRSDLSDKMVHEYHQTTIPLIIKDNPWIPDFDDYILRYIKCFDDSLDEDDQDNYYMEREWRILDQVEFTLENVNKIILPESYGERFHDEFPQYSGMVKLV